MSQWDSRFFRLFMRPADLAGLTEQVADLHATINSMAQDIRTLHTLLERVWPGGAENFWAHYRTERAAVMVADAGGPGPDPFRQNALYGYTLDPEEFLAERLGATPEEIARFREEVEFRQQLT